MDLLKVLAQLREELANLDAAIASLERLQDEGRKWEPAPKAPSTPKRSPKAEERPPASLRKTK